MNTSTTACSWQSEDHSPAQGKNGKGLPRKRIMLVEDEFLIAAAVKQSLQRHGYEVPAVVSAGKEAIRCALKIQPDLILMDIDLEGAMNGIEAAAEIRLSCDTPIVYLTGQADAATIEKAKATEPLAFLTKPCNLATMVGTIEMAIYKTEAEAVRKKSEQELDRLREAHAKALAKNEERYRAQLSQKRNIEVLATLAGGIAHDFNNLFQVFLGNLSLAKMYLHDEHEAMNYLEKAENVFVQATKLTNQMITLSSDGRAQGVDLQPAKFIREAMAASEQGCELIAEVDPASDLWCVHADPGQFRQVLANLVTNARESMPPGGTIRVTAANEQLPEGRRPEAIPPGRYVRISVQDHGCGIHDEHLPRIFDPYFSTKERGSKKGMGLGLTLCKAIAQNHGGTITVETRVGQGSTFHLYLPAVGLSNKEKGVITQEPAEGGPRILIMDDDTGVTELASSYLKVLGYRVDTVSKGEAAIAAYQEARTAGAPYAAVILDLTIPGGIGGMEVCTRLKAIDPDVEIIISSGYSDHPAITDCTAYGFADVLVKPYQLNTIKRVLTRLLEV